MNSSVRSSKGSFHIADARTRGAKQNVSRTPWMMIIFVCVMVFVAAMSFASIFHLQGHNLYDLESKTMSSLLKYSEEKVLFTAEQVLSALDASSNYIHNHMGDPFLRSSYNATNLDNVVETESGEEYVNAHLASESEKKDMKEEEEEEEEVHQVSSNGKSADTGRKRLAYVITITKDGMFQDGAAVLAYSIMKYSRDSEYDISLIAFVHPNVSTSRPGLQRLGFHVIEVPTPVNTSAITFPFLRDHIDKNGCCGAAELIKITSYRFVRSKGCTQCIFSSVFVLVFGQ